MRLPQVIGPWQLIQRLGHGAFGSVYLAEVEGDAGFTSRVAVKLLDSGAIESNPTIGQSLIDEAKLLSRLQHPGIVRVLDLQQVSHEFLGETYAMSMEYVEGITLSALLENIGLQASSLSISAILSVFSEITAALEYAHSHIDDDGNPSLIVHRDLKPANLIVTPEGHVKVLDFGIAWAAERGVEATREGVTKGTLPYMSPEQVHGLDVDGRSDLYALGTIVFEMLVGEPFVGFYPFGQSDIARMVKRVAELTFEKRRELLRDTLQKHPHFLDELQAQSIENLLAKLLARNPSERFESAKELGVELESLYVFWRPEVGRRELGSHMDTWYAENPPKSEFHTVPYEAESRSSGGGEAPEDKDSPPAEGGAVSESSRSQDELDELGSRATMPQPMPALHSAETAPVPPAAAKEASASPQVLREETTRVFTPSGDPTDAGPSSIPPESAESSGSPQAAESPSGEEEGEDQPTPGDRPPKTNPALRSAKAAGPAPTQGRERIEDTERFRRVVLGMILFGLLLFVLAPDGDDDSGSENSGEPAEEAPSVASTAVEPTLIADARVTTERSATDARTTVSFVDSKGNVVLAPVLPGLKSADSLAVIRGEDGWLDFAVVGTRAYESSRGLLMLWDLQGAEPREVWRVDDFFAETPEIDIGVHGATLYGFGGVDFLPGEDNPPHVVAVAHDRNFAPAWLLRLDSKGEILGRRYHPGHLSGIFALDGFNLVVRGVSNRLCPGGKVPCEQEEVVWLVPPPGAAERTEFLPGCGGTPTVYSGRGYSWPQNRFRIKSVVANASANGGFELKLLRRARPKREKCEARLEFGNDGEFRSQFSECGFEAPIYEITQEAGLICLEWEKLSAEER